MTKNTDDLIRIQVGDSFAEIVIPSWASMKEVLAAVDEWADAPGNSGQAANMWRVLTALRGPDQKDPSGLIKSLTTAVIRRHALPKLTARVGADLARHDARVDLNRLSGPNEVGDEWSKQPGHFKGHIQDAVYALDIEKKELSAEEVVKEAQILLTRLKSTLLDSDARKAEALQALLAEYTKAKGLA